MALKVVIVGYGRMGEEIEKALLQRSHQIVARVDPKGATDNRAIVPSIAEAPLAEADVAIEFSVGNAVAENISHYCAQQLPAVIGTTGWSIPAQQLRLQIEEAQSACIIGDNFSIGAHIFFRLLERAAQISGAFPEYDIMLQESHHAHKLDSPSGTARTAAARIIAHHPVKQKIVSDALQRSIRPEELHISSLRGGSIPGIHRAIIDAPADTIEISHSARNRAGFALGAVLAAEWIATRQGLYTMDNLMDELIGSRCTCR